LIAQRSSPTRERRSVDEDAAAGDIGRRGTSIAIVDFFDPVRPMTPEAAGQQSMPRGSGAAARFGSRSHARSESAARLGRQAGVFGVLDVGVM
jgi:hypothetical protein